MIYKKNKQVTTKKKLSALEEHERRVNLWGWGSGKHEQPKPILENQQVPQEQRDKPS